MAQFDPRRQPTRFAPHLLTAAAAPTTTGTATQDFSKILGIATDHRLSLIALHTVATKPVSFSGMDSRVLCRRRQRVLEKSAVLPIYLM